jgi:hypothetical protein
MKFKQYEDGSCDIEFSWRERFIFLKKGKLHLDPIAAKHFANHLMHFLANVQLKFKNKLETLNTFEDTEVKTK